MGNNRQLQNQQQETKERVKNHPDLAAQQELSSSTSISEVISSLP